MTVQLKDIKLEIKVEKNDTKAQYENSTVWNLRSDQDNINTSAIVKNEYESEEDDESIHNRDSFMNIERIYIKEEKLENQNVNEDYLVQSYKEDLIKNSNIHCKNEIYIEEHPLSEVKDEPISTTETPQDGSTSQADTETDAELNSFESVSNASEKNIKLYECEICKKTFKQGGDLVRHLRIHTGERPYACDVCTKTFIQSGDLSRHMRVHGGSKPYICEICNEQFVQKRNLQSHIRGMHTDNRTYECEICKKKFTKRSNLNSHMRCHSKQRPHVCEICNKTFIHKWHLDIHMRKHSGERPYECKLCVKRFIQSGDLRRHMRVHTGERPYECEICKKTFCVKSNFTKHTQTHHSETII